MDGMCGGKWGNRLMTANYELLDRRFNVGVAHPTETMHATLITNMELFLYPLITGAAYVFAGVFAPPPWWRWWCAAAAAVVVVAIGMVVMVEASSVACVCAAGTWAS
jgi:hypothetical protein